VKRPNVAVASSTGAAKERELREREAQPAEALLERRLVGSAGGILRGLLGERREPVELFAEVPAQPLECAPRLEDADD